MKLKRYFSWLFPRMSMSAQSEAQLTESQKLLVDVSAFLFSVLVWWFVVVSGVLVFFLNVDLSKMQLMDKGPPAILVAIAFGMLGGFIALHRRLPGLSVEEMRLLNSSRFFTALTPLVGGMLAGLLYILFIAELVTSDLFPSFSFPEQEAGASRSFSDLFQVHGTEGKDYAKLIVWCFVAGLSEKFVTNMLGGLQQAVSGGSGSGPGPAGGGSGPAPGGSGSEPGGSGSTPGGSGSESGEGGAGSSVEGTGAGKAGV